MRRVASVLAVFLFLIPALVPESRAIVAAPYDEYHDLEEVEADLRSWSSDPRVTLESMGKSAGDRNLWVLRIAAEGTVAPDERPGVFVGANIAGDHQPGTEAALHLVETLLDRDPESLRDTTFYVAPVLNPDAHGSLFAEPRYRRGGNDQEVDRDVDGLVAEDGYDDLNGDGVITWMRIPDPAGSWLPHPEEPRVMVRADPLKERAGSYRLVREGRDDDGD
ncbi:MAG: M14 family zinc carboxypeptidase, partial [Thermoanaerobaculia bacterium]|nr:M14 family zinc carboxypeptidase [Thermoanaerobaculia bacterium]